MRIVVLLVLAGCAGRSIDSDPSQAQCGVDTCTTVDEPPFDLAPYRPVDLARHTHDGPSCVPSDCQPGFCCAYPDGYSDCLSDATSCGGIILCDTPSDCPSGTGTCCDLGGPKHCCTI
jgi:hypothetical protein